MTSSSAIDEAKERAATARTGGKMRKFFLGWVQVETIWYRTLEICVPSESPYFHTSAIGGHYMLNSSKRQRPNDKGVVVVVVVQCLLLMWFGGDTDPR